MSPSLTSRSPSLFTATVRKYSDSLQESGRSSTTYDKRVGKSTGNWGEATFEDLADDAVAAAKFLQARTDIAAESYRLALMFQRLKNEIIVSPTSNDKWDRYDRARAIAKDKNRFATFGVNSAFNAEVFVAEPMRSRWSLICPGQRWNSNWVNGS